MFHLGDSFGISLPVARGLEDAMDVEGEKALTMVTKEALFPP